MVEPGQPEGVPGRLSASSKTPDAAAAPQKLASRVARFGEPKAENPPLAGKPPCHGCISPRIDKEGERTSVSSKPMLGFGI
jgi:hypothetical protein